MRVDRETCTDYARSSKLEWLQTNGTGGFAMGTVSGANTRRYHGLLVASLDPPVERYVLLSKLEEEVVVGGRLHALGANQYPGAVHPNGYQYLSGFRLAPYPAWTYEVAGARIEKRVLLVEGEQAVVVEYRADWPCRLIVRPFLAFRDYHGLAQANGAFQPAISERERTIQIRPYPALPALTLEHSGAVFEVGGAWYYNYEYLEELERGLDFREDLYCLGSFVFDLAAGTPAWVAAGIKLTAAWSFPAVSEEMSFEGRLKRAGEQFRVRRADGKPTILAGYPWFTDWGRDTMIALPGLCVEETQKIVEGFLQQLHQGLIPNRFPDQSGSPEYNTADATLWMFQAVWAYQESGGDASFFYPAAREIIAWHQRGTLHGIEVDPEDGLLTAGDESTNLTWMDARCEGRPVTPRHGKTVEINALWYNALRMMGVWTGERGFTQAARQAKASFDAKFWNPARSCLYDVLRSSGLDAALRPNQIFAVSLPFPLLDRARQRTVVESAKRDLLTPYGLRTLAPGEPGYQGQCRGGPAERDRAYHQGTVWPWLLGPFVAAYLRAWGRSKKNLAWCRSLVEAFGPELDRGCLGTIGEVYDGDVPHLARGAPAQAWSVAALLTALAES